LPFEITGTGRFLTPDPYMAAAGGPNDPSNPGSWNRYAYVQGDPVNHIDRSGLELSAQDCINNPEACEGQDWGGGVFGGDVGGSPGGGTFTCPSGDYFDAESGSCEQSSNDDEDPAPDCLSSFSAKDVSFVTTNYASAVSLQNSSGVPQDWILGWSANESNWGVSPIATKSGNYFGWHGGGNIPCPNGTNKAVGCFSSYLASGTTALFSIKNWFHYNGKVHVSSASILTSQISNGAGAAQAFQALADAGYDGNPNYGATIAGPNWLGTVDGIEDCLKSLGKLK
jgi:hypothetical protein